MDKIFSRLKRYRRIFVCLGLALACFAASALVYFSAVRPFAGKCFSVKICDSYENFTPIETQVSQTFTTSFDVMNLTFMFQIPGEQPRGELSVELYDTATGELLATSTGVMDHILNGQYTGLGLSALADSQGQNRQYTAVLTPHYQTEARLSIGYSAQPVHEGETLVLNGEAVNGTLAQYISSAPIGRFLSVYYWLAALLLTALLCGLYLFLSSRHFALHTAVFGIVMVLGLAFTMALPPYAAPDEQYHINESFTIASFWANRVSGDEWVMQDVPIFYSYRRPCDFNSIIQNQKTTVFTWKEFSYHLTDTTTDQLGDHVWLFEEQADTYPILYVCSAAGVFLAFCLHLGFAPALLLGRLFNLTAFALLSAWAVKKAPFGKMAFVGAALLPMTLHQAASFSRDSLLLGLCFAFTALCLDLAYAPGSALCWQKLVPLAVMGVVIAPAKVVYAPLIALVLLAAVRQIHVDRKLLLGAAAAFLAVCAVFVVWNNRYLLRSSASADSNQVTAEQVNDSIRQEYEDFLESTGGESVIVDTEKEDKPEPVPGQDDSVCFTLRYILGHPAATVMLCANSLIQLGDHYVRTLVGGSLSYYSLDIAWTWVAVLYLLLFLCCLPCRGEQKLCSAARLWAGFLALACCGLAVLGCICWTPTYYDTIYGLQGRYFLPVLPLGLLALAPAGLRPAGSGFTRKLLFAFTAVDCMVVLNILIAVIAR